MRRNSRSRRAGRLVLLLLAPLAFTGCAAPQSPLPSVEVTLAELQPAFTGGAVRDCLALPLPAQRQCRDTIVQSMLVAIDLRYAEYELAFFNANRGVGFGSSVTLLGLGAAGSLAATGTSQVLSAISAAVAGTREAFGRELLADQTSAALLTTMRNGRNQVALRIRDGLRLDSTQYPLGVALSDVYAYFRAGTLPGAVAGLTQLVGARAQATQDELRATVVGQGLATTPTATRLRGFLDAPGLTEAQRDRRMADLLSAKRAEGLDDPSVTSLLRDDSPQGEERRARLARRLGLLP